MLTPPFNEHVSREDTWFLNVHTLKEGIFLFPISNQHFPFYLGTWWHPDPLSLNTPNPKTSRERADLWLVLQSLPLASSLINPFFAAYWMSHGWLCCASSIWTWNQLQNQRAVNRQGSNYSELGHILHYDYILFHELFLFPDGNSYFIFLFPWLLYQLSPHSNIKTNSPLNMVTNISHSVSLILFLETLFLEASALF